MKGVFDERGIYVRSNEASVAGVAWLSERVADPAGTRVSAIEGDS